MSLPKMRTIPEAIKEIKNNDPNTAFTERALRRMVNIGELPVVTVGNKKLVNMDVLYEYLHNGNTIITSSNILHSKVRRIG